MAKKKGAKMNAEKGGKKVVSKKAATSPAIIKKAAGSAKKAPASKAGARSESPTAREKKIQKIRAKLVAQKEVLLAEAESAISALPEEQTVFPDLGDQASIETDRNFMLRLKGREQRLLKKIDEALERIDAGIYGICEVCGEEIRIQRLEARLVTTMCIDCKTEQEEEEKLLGS